MNRKPPFENKASQPRLHLTAFGADKRRRVG